jgi:beta-glucosidase
MKNNNKTITLPANSPMAAPDFIFGVGTSSFQIEGAVHSREPSIWDTFCNQPGAILDGSDGITACDHVARWEEDVELIAALGVDAYRLSLSWPRIVQRDGSANEAGIQWYIKLLDKLAVHNIKAFVTLYHWDLPQHLEDAGGWLNRQTAYDFRDYVDLVTKAFGKRVYSYATLNEPMCSAYLGYEIGMHAPGIKDKAAGITAAHHLLLAHGLAMPVLRKNSPDALNGIVLNLSPCYPASASSADKLAAKTADDRLFGWYLRPLLEGAYPDLLAALPAAEQPPIMPGDLELISQPIDYLGINYYTRAVHRAPDASIDNAVDCDRGFVELPPTPPVAGATPLTDMGWEVYPQGLTDLLLNLQQTYKGKLPPLYVAENGAAIADTLVDGHIDDPQRIAYLQSHLLAVNAAMAAGVDIRGYFCWSLMDNFEWSLGYQKRFGIVYVDFKTQQRIMKASAHAYRDMMQRRTSAG